MSATHATGLFDDPPPDPPADPGERFACPDARRAAWEAWVAAGRPWPPDPPGMLSAICGAAMGSRKR